MAVSRTLATMLLILAMMGPWAPASSATTLTITREGGLLWVDATFADTDAEHVTIKILTPRDSDGDRRLWQRCTLPFVGAGLYRCALDVSADAPAAALEGHWLARVSVDQTVLTRALFRT